MVSKARLHGNRKRATTAHTAQMFSHLHRVTHFIGEAKLPFKAPATIAIRMPTVVLLMQLNTPFYTANQYCPIKVLGFLSNSLTRLG